MAAFLKLHFFVEYQNTMWHSLYIYLRGPDQKQEVVSLQQHSVARLLEAGGV